MKKVVVAGAALAVVLAACSTSNEVVASVNGTDITRGEVESLVSDPGGGFSSTDFATYLGLTIQWQATEQAAAEQFGFEITDAQVDERIDELVFEFSPGAKLDDYLESVNASKEGIRKYAYQLILQDLIYERLTADLDPVTDEEVAKELADFPMDWTQICVSHILVGTPQEAADVQARLDAGEDFASLASELSLDTESGVNGGDLGCASPSGYPGPFAEAAVDAEIGVVTDPVETEFGYHLILVTDRTTADSEQVRQYLEQVKGSEAVDEWFLSVIEAADVTVDESIGEWTTDPKPRVIATL